MTIRDGGLIFGLYEQNCIGMGAGAVTLWRDRHDRRLEALTPGYWLDLARICEEGGLDLIFFGDVLGMYDTYAGSAETAITYGVELPAHDPAVLAGILAAATERLSFVVTASTTYSHPFDLARRFSTIDHLSGGRFGWNVVTSYLPNAAGNFGLDRMIDHDERYEIAEEFLDVTYQLWEGSWADDAFIADPASGLFANADRVRPINHDGKHFRVAGPHVSVPSRQRTPVIFQSGWSPRGRRFGARHAEVIFAGADGPESFVSGLADIRAHAAGQGRNPADVSALSSLSVVTAPTEAEVQRKVDRMQSVYVAEAQMAAFSAWSGVDLAAHTADDLAKRRTGHTESVLQEAGSGPAPLRIEELRRSHRSFYGGDHSGSFIGTPDVVADAIERHARVTGTAGYILRTFVSPETVEDFVTLILPRLRERGLHQPPSAVTTLRSRLRGTDRLPDTHPAARHRWPAVVAR
ncbi:NtaA/DmoA family FMN-dependent monooxygenase [Mycobacterium yunnanensis]|uniref:NtaA/DmoA family FMN-dependent monooxygenase n=1 Tax=Mycobacterium yunnanensis TaxID=368477 RepID=A0A9X2Z8D1_9MYCO|nr:NtaA/DmoA family FMN-dependent monooxygenase [Mycobacterium yunnanensis]MCV7423999.1 NtaA/DmoA family FMN-dependent monooxygenase [Mycobacterium yunnanensis]